MGGTAAAPQHWLVASSALSDRRNGNTDGTTQPAAHPSAGGQTNTQSGNNDHADDPLPGGCQGSPVGDHGDESDHAPGGWPHTTGGNPDQIAEHDDGLGSWGNSGNGSDPSCQPCPQVDFPPFLRDLIEGFVGRLNDQNPPTTTSSGHDRLEAALGQLVQALAGEFSDCAGFDPGSSSSASSDATPHTTIAAAWHQ
jgi:hypothetical protein